MKKNRTLYWAITGHCQLHCRYCFYETGMNKRPFEFIDACRAECIIDDIADNFDAVTLTGGEPMLTPSFWKIVGMGRAAGLDVSFLTDGIGINDKSVALAVEHGVTRIAVSLDSLEPGVNESLRRPGRTHKGITERVVENVKLLGSQRGERLQATILQTVCRTNIDSIKPMVGFCNTLDVDLLVHPAGIPMASTDFQDIGLASCSPDEVCKLEHAMLEWADGHEGRERYTRLAIDFIRGTRPTGIICPMGRQFFFLDVDGTIAPCFHRMDLELGNIFETDLGELLSKDLPQDLSRGPCASLACACMLE